MAAAATALLHLSKGFHVMCDDLLCVTFQRTGAVDNIESYSGYSTSQVTANTS